MKSIKLVLLTFTISVTNLLDAQCQKDTVFFYEIELNTKNKTVVERSVYQYNSSGLVSEILFQKPGSTTSQWINESKSIYSYDANKNKTQEISQLWNTDNSNWVNQSKINNSYDSKNNLIQEVVSGWIPASNSWTEAQKRDLTINNKNKVTEELVQIWNFDNSGWDNYLKSSFTFDGEQNLIEILSVSWDSDKSQWNNIFNSILKYNSENKKIEEITQTWDIDNSEWRNDKKVIYTYDGKNLSEMYTYYTTSDGKNWLDYSKETYEYINDEDIIAVNRFSRWNEINENFDNQYREEIICLKNSSSVNNILANSISLYPNPTSGFITIKTLFNSNYNLIDCIGKEHQKGFLLEGTNFINLNQIKSGIYFLKINNQTYKLIIQ